jgi:hypothetical protein
MIEKRGPKMEESVPGEKQGTQVTKERKDPRTANPVISEKGLRECVPSCRYPCARRCDSDR